MTLETLSPAVGMSIYSGQSANVMIGYRKNARFVGIVNPPDYNTKIAENTFKKSHELEDITIFLPRLERVADLEISIEDDAVIEPPTPYKYGPILYYGSSITEGGVSSRVTNVYSALISSELDADYYNFGFSGSARGELEMAKLISEIPMKLFVLDYDHNAPTAEHLSATHEPFFRYIREKDPTLPIIMVTRPAYIPNHDADARAEIIYSTYKNAVESGDENVWFVDGREFFNQLSPLCSVDDCHPNDLGFYLMAQKLLPIVKEALKIE